MYDPEKMESLVKEEISVITIRCGLLITNLQILMRMIGGLKGRHPQKSCEIPKKWGYLYINKTLYLLVHLN